MSCRPVMDVAVMAETKTTTKKIKATPLQTRQKVAAYVESVRANYNMDPEVARSLHTTIILGMYLDVVRLSYCEDIIEGVEGVFYDSYTNSYRLDSNKITSRSNAVRQHIAVVTPHPMYTSRGKSCVKSWNKMCKATQEVARLNYEQDVSI
jgi:hypothetical protein